MISRAARFRARIALLGFHLRGLWRALRFALGAQMIDNGADRPWRAGVKRAWFAAVAGPDSTMPYHPTAHAYLSSGDRGVWTPQDRGIARLYLPDTADHPGSYEIHWRLGDGCIHFHAVRVGDEPPWPSAPRAS
jgi:hypothetical protein